MFKELQHKLTSTEPQHYLALLNAQNISDYQGYLLFNLANLDNIFYQNLDFLKDDDIWGKEELQNYTVFAQTIDNDYILATTTSVLVIPYSLNKKDSETFDLSINEFLIALENHTLKTTILSL
ncbi:MULTISPECIES: hypothetical protein [Vagococcus]|uniref:Uncharacterized protein n=1 Tax=Vagococcus fluvialis bH819 TaxID=1255619 RepID=A0A1X6WM67_9ENTE|nr:MULTISPECIES: hypothetical protein [Vagococcus]SLM85332.1 hypothetical protein FM121_04490 [Vagococcus fluvialis bH819]HCM89374.1 hypothetical protein [Vagococcus sp.]